MELSVGNVTEGKVTGIMKFGAFVALPSGKSGLVHISEIVNSYVANVRDYLSEGQTVKVKIIGIDENGRINLSIKKAAEDQGDRSGAARGVSGHANQNSGRYAGGGYMGTGASQESKELSFEDKLKQFMQYSDSKISGIKQYSDKRSYSQRRGRR